MALLNPITSEVKPRSFSVIDLEWIPADHLPMPVNTNLSIGGFSKLKIPLPVDKKISDPLKLRLAAYYDQIESTDYETDEPVKEERYESFSSVAELLDALLTHENFGRWFYAHAGGLADMEFVLDELLLDIKSHVNLDVGLKETISMPTEAQRRIGITRHEDKGRGDLRIRASFSGSSAIIVHIAKGKNAWHFVDSYWLLRDKLANIGKAIKIHKGDTPSAVAFLKFKFGKEKLDDLDDNEIETFFREAPLDVLTSYNRVDCEILWKAIAAFEEEILSLGGQLQQTIASTGMNLFRRQYLKRTIYTSEKLNKIAEESYFSSRVENLSRNCEDFFMYDINSSFPYSMTLAQPAGLESVQTTLPDEDSDECIYIADVTVEVPEMELPPVPYRMGGRVFFPVGRWRSWLTSTDIRLAMREGCTIHKVHEVYVFEPFYDLRGYAEDIYAKRAAADTPFRKLVLKYLLNSLYGKYAESMIKQEMLINPDEIDRETMQLLQPGIWLKDNEVTVVHRHVPISTIITAIARRTLYDYMKACLQQGLPVYYCDTDSIATKATLPTDDKQLGALKLEKKLDWAEFIAPKIYRGEGFELDKNGTWKPVQMTKAKGFSLGKHKREAWEKFSRIVSGDRIGIQRQIRLRELYRSGMTSPVDVLVIKALTFDMLSKRFHYPDGETRPWTITELRSGEIYPKGFDFEPSFWTRMDTTTKAMIEACI